MLTVRFRQLTVGELSPPKIRGLVGCSEDALCTLHPCCSRWLQCPYQRVAIRQRRNTRYGWMVSPYPTGTCTRQEAPSFAWRTNVWL